jgi:Na+-translocating ferredoxin:NAD+ oxidoreductase subunit G
LTYEGTKDRIERLKRKLWKKPFSMCCPESQNKNFPNDLKVNSFLLMDRTEAKHWCMQVMMIADTFAKVLPLRQADKDMRMSSGFLYGYNPSTQTVVGFYVLESKETPGLGDKIEKDENFLANFRELSVALSADLSQVENKVSRKTGK